MTKTIKYIGSQKSWPELPVTGRQSIWRRGQQDDRPDGEADLLLGTGLFTMNAASVTQDPVTGRVYGAAGEIAALTAFATEFDNGGAPVLARPSTWSARPADADYIGQILMLDIGPRGSLWRWDGVSKGLVNGMAVLYVNNVAGATLTGTTALTPMVSVPIPAGLLGPNGALECEVKFSVNSSAGNKTVTCALGTTGFGGVTVSGSLLSSGSRWNIQNRNSEAAQIGSNTSPHGLSSNAASFVLGAENTAVAKNFVVNAQLGTAGDSITIEAVRLILVRP